MKISSQLKYNAVVSIFLVTGLFILLFTNSYAMKRELKKFGLANELVRKTSSLIVLTHEYLYKREVRSQKQWQYQYDSLQNTLGMNRKNANMESLEGDLEILKRHFDKLVEDHASQERLQGPGVQQGELNKFHLSDLLLSDQMQLVSQKILTQVLDMAVAAEVKVNTLRMRTNYAAIAFGLILIGVTVANSHAALRRIARPLAMLVNHVNRIEKSGLGEEIIDGNLEAAIHEGDEVGALWNAFADMKTRLKAAFEEIRRELGERKTAEAETRKKNDELRRLRNLLADIVNFMPSMLVGLDDQGRVTHWNREAEHLTGATEAQAMGKPLGITAPSLAEWLDMNPAMIPAGNHRKASRVPLKFREESLITDITVFSLEPGGQTGVVLRVDDVSDRVRLDEMMIQSEKMLSLGGLTAGVAHEINNPLAGILQNMQVAVSRFSLNMPKNRKAALASGTTMEAIDAYLKARKLHKTFALIVESGERAANIVENMLSFGRKGGAVFESCDLRELLDRTLDLAASDYNLKKKYDFRKVRITREYDSSAPLVTCDRSKIQQVFFNLLQNAAHAMMTQEPSPAQPTIHIRVASARKGVEVTIEDNGPGMPEAVKKRMFEPFFTTKGIGEGTGLGLFVAYFIISENHGGTMDVKSEPGKGARFTLFLPLKPPAPILSAAEKKKEHAS